MEKKPNKFHVMLIANWEYNEDNTDDKDFKLTSLPCAKADNAEMKKLL